MCGRTVTDISEEWSMNPPSEPFLVIEDRTAKSMAIAEHVATNLKGLETDMYAGDTAILAYAVLHAQNATNQMLVTLISGLNNSVEGMGLLFEDIQRSTGVMFE